MRWPQKSGEVYASQTPLLGSSGGSVLVPMAPGHDRSPNSTFSRLHVAPDSSESIWSSPLNNEETRVTKVYQGRLEESFGAVVRPCWSRVHHPCAFTPAVKDL